VSFLDEYLHNFITFSNNSEPLVDKSFEQKPNFVYHFFECPQVIDHVDQMCICYTLDQYVQEKQVSTPNCRDLIGLSNGLISFLPL
jgi:hypothetical protein